MTATKDLTDQLFEELATEKPSEEKVRALVSDGANIKAINNCGDNVIMDAISNGQHYLNDAELISLVKLLIELGAEVNHTDEGFNCLFLAYLTYRPVLVEMILKAGANPNCISTESPESLLDWVLFDQGYEETGIPEKDKPIQDIVDLLKKYGAKRRSELISVIH